MSPACRCMFSLTARGSFSGSAVLPRSRRLGVNVRGIRVHAYGGEVGVADRHLFDGLEVGPFRDGKAVGVLALCVISVCQAAVAAVAAVGAREQERVVLAQSVVT